MTQTLEKRADVVDRIDALLTRVDQQKQAAEANTEAGGFQGETSHPVKNVDDRTDDAQEGARSAENTADVKEDQGSPAVDNTAPGTPGGQDSVQMNIGTNQSATGEDSTVETESAKGGKDDPGSSHPAKTDNDALDGHKYSQARQTLQLIKAAQEKGTELIAEIAVQTEGDLKKRAQEIQAKQAEPTAAGDPSGASATPDSEPDAEHPPGKGKKKEAEDAVQAGAEMADAAMGQYTPEQLKQAQDQMIYGAITESVQIAFDMADKTAAFIQGHVREKQALGEDEQRREEEENGAPPAGGEGGEIPPANPLEGLLGGGEQGAGGLGAPGGGDEETALLELLSQGDGEPGLEGGEMGGEMAGGMGGEMGGGMGGGVGGDIGGEAALAEMLGGAGGPGGEPGGGMGGEPGGGMGGEMGGEPSPEDLAMLQAALQQVGASPEAFEAATAGKMAAALKQAPQSVPADWKPKTAAQAQQLQRMVNYIREVTGTN